MTSISPTDQWTNKVLRNNRGCDNRVYNWYIISIIWYIFSPSGYLSWEKQIQSWWSCFLTNNYAKVAINTSSLLDISFFVLKFQQYCQDQVYIFKPFHEDRDYCICIIFGRKKLQQYNKTKWTLSPTKSTSDYVLLMSLKEMIVPPQATGMVWQCNDIIKHRSSSACTAWVQNSCRIISLMFAIWDANNWY